MYRYQILVEYVGTKFIGWQKQLKGKSIQKEIENKLSKLLKQKIIIYGSGRTDAGVHALAQVAHFDLKKKIKKKSLLPAIIQNIGNNPITILKINKTSKKFHARFDAKKRTYQYIIINRQSPLALQKNKAWHIRKKLNVKSMKKGAKLLLGTHNFSTYRAASCGAKSPIRTMQKILIKKNKDKIILQFTSRSFLQQQVRSMVGCIKYLGEGRWNLKDFKNSFMSKKRSECAPPAPACGLYLAKIKY